MIGAVAEDFLNEKTRAEDIILGSLGFGEGASIISIKRTAEGFAGVGRWFDGERFEFENDDELDALQEWALTILIPRGN